MGWRKDMVSSIIQQENSFMKATITKICMKDGAWQPIIKDNSKEEKKKVGGYGKIKKEA